MATGLLQEEEEEAAATTTTTATTTAAATTAAAATTTTTTTTPTAVATTTTAAAAAETAITTATDSNVSELQIARPPGDIARASTVGQKRPCEEESSLSEEKKWPGWPGENVFRLIVPVSKVGSIIGRKGELVKKMCEETRARIKIIDGVPGTLDRVVMISAREEVDVQISPAMDGLLRVHRRIMDGLDSESEARASASAASTKLLVPVTQAGHLIGKQGATIKSIQDASGASVRIVSSEELPICALADDRVVEVQGEPMKVLKAIELVAKLLRKFLVDKSILPMFEIPRNVQNQSQQSAAHLTWATGSAVTHPSSVGSGLGHYGSSASTLGGATVYSSYNAGSHYAATSYHHDAYPSGDAYESHNYHHGVSLYGRDPSIGGISNQAAGPPPAPIITQVTQKMQIPLSYADAIIGASGANVSYMRRTSGATITIQETRGINGEMTVEVHGTAAQVQTAQQLVQSFMAGSSTLEPYSSYSSSQNPYSSSYSSSYSSMYGF